MIKLELNPDQLERIRQLRSQGLTWKRIQDQTGIDYGIVKSEYKNWEQNQPLFRAHIETCAAIGWHLASKLETVRLPTDLRSSIECLNDLLSVPITNIVNPQAVAKKDSVAGTNQALLQALRKHTHNYVSWHELDSWCRRWDSMGNMLNKLNGLARIIVPSREIDQTTFTNLNQELWDVVMKYKIDGPILDFRETSSYLERFSQDIRDSLESIYVAYFIPNEVTAVLKKLVGGTFEPVNEMYFLVFFILINMEAMRSSKAILMNELSLSSVEPILLRTHCKLCPTR